MTDWHPQACGEWLWSACSLREAVGGIVCGRVVQQTASVCFLCALYEMEMCSRRGGLFFFFLPRDGSIDFLSSLRASHTAERVVGSRCAPIDSMRVSRVNRLGMEAALRSLRLEQRLHPSSSCSKL